MSSTYFTLVLYPWPDQERDPLRQPGYLTEASAHDIGHKDTTIQSRYQKRTSYSRYEVVCEPLPDPKLSHDEPLYTVVYPDGSMETGARSYANPKLYQLRYARAVANSFNKRAKRENRAFARIVPVTLAFGAPV